MADLGRGRERIAEGEGEAVKRVRGQCGLPNKEVYQEFQIPTPPYLR